MHNFGQQQKRESGEQEKQSRRQTVTSAELKQWEEASKPIVEKIENTPIAASHDLERRLAQFSCEGEEGAAMQQQHGSKMNPLDEAIASRYSIPPIVVAALKRAGHVAALKLLNLIESPSFDSLPVSRQLQIIDMALVKAYGRDEAASSFDQRMQLSGMESVGGKKSLTAQLKEIEAEDFVAPEMRKATSASEGKRNSSAQRGTDLRRSDNQRSDEERGGGVEPAAASHNFSATERRAKPRSPLAVLESYAEEKVVNLRDRPAFPHSKDKKGAA